MTLKHVLPVWVWSPYALSDARRVTIWVNVMNTFWVKLKCIRSEWYLTHTPWVTLDCVQPEWSWSAYPLNDDQPNTCWVNLKSKLPEWCSGRYILSEIRYDTIWVTFEWLPTESLSNDTVWVIFNWIPSEWLSTEYLLCDGHHEYGLSDGQMYHLCDAKVHTSCVKLKFIHTE